MLATLAALPPWLVLGAVLAAPALEASTFAGLVVPGETVVVIGGVLAQQGRVPLAAVMAAAVVGAVVGDGIGYAIGARFGPALFTRASGRTAQRLRRAQEFVRRFGAPAVFLGRWVAVLRALVPSTAGASRVPYARFALYNLAGGATWGCAVSVLGYVAGTGYGRAERVLGVAGAVVLAMLILALAVVAAWAHRRRQT